MKVSFSRQVSLFASDSKLLLLSITFGSREGEFSDGRSKLTCSVSCLGRNTGTELHLDRPSTSFGGGVTRISTSTFEMVILWFDTGNGNVEDRGFSTFNLVTCSGKRYGWLAFKIGSTVLKLKSSEPLRSDITVSVDEHLERFVSSQIFLGGGLQHWKIFLNFSKKPIHMLRQSLFINNKKKNAMHTKAGATMLIRGNTVL